MSFQCGVELSAVPDIVKSVVDMGSVGYDFLVVPLVHPRHRRSVPAMPTVPFTRSDLLLNSGQWTSYVVGKTSPWLDFGSPNAQTRLQSEKVFEQELMWASHLSLPAVLLPTPLPSSLAPYAQCVHNALLRHTFLQAWLRVPLTFSSSFQVDPLDSDHSKNNTANGRSLTDPWEWWNSFRVLCNQHAHLAVALELTADLPSDDVLDKWAGEPIKVVIIPTSIFMTNASGFPALSPRHQKFLKRIFESKAQYVLSGTVSPPSKGSAYLTYLGHLHAEFLSTRSEQDTFESPYYDYLQTPLQPLADNLESQTYETFEKDPVKYARYEEAVYKALLDRCGNNTAMTTVLMVVGAGRGPLVRASLRASERAQREIRVYAVEKNPNAVVTLQNMRISLGWGDKVTIIPHDMRTWDAPEKADILVSELLGSFGDNELSPECLDGAQKFLKTDGISIPKDSTSFLSPLSSHTLHNEVRNFNDAKMWETSYVVRIHNGVTLAESQPCFHFVHPNHEDPINNDRYTVLRFKSRTSALMHGFAGYFETTLYKDVMLSINPQTFSTGMFSWFPLYFPIKDPIYVKEGQEVECHFWRKGRDGKVWYEWAVTSPDISMIHNPSGRSSTINL
eukprot:TRINITY_DN3524_c0_g1_i1.p1 TRINITY_DN3524_c0_g1~~TRINITY_DN3524_c0_g1_i1.p1  ORF type:complete len:618 (+),score=110.21 TRINITY_DN3524_c0_g1_i1:228-2081(+)